MSRTIETREGWPDDVPAPLAAWLEAIERELSATVPGYDIVFNREPAEPADPDAAARRGLAR